MENKETKISSFVILKNFIRDEYVASYVVGLGGVEAIEVYEECGEHAMVKFIRCTYENGKKMEIKKSYCIVVYEGS